MHMKTASFDLTDFKHCPPNENGDPGAETATQVWNEKFATTFAKDSVEEQWADISTYCIEFLLENGARWTEGAKTRGEPPEFVSKQICPGQVPSGTVKTHWLHFAYQALNRLTELSFRLRRVTYTQADWRITRTTVRKTFKAPVGYTHLG